MKSIIINSRRFKSIFSFGNPFSLKANKKSDFLSKTTVFLIKLPIQFYAIPSLFALYKLSKLIVYFPTTSFISFVIILALRSSWAKKEFPLRNNWRLGQYKNGLRIASLLFYHHLKLTNNHFETIDNALILPFSKLEETLKDDRSLFSVIFKLDFNGTKSAAKLYYTVRRIKKSTTDAQNMQYKKPFKDPGDDRKKWYERQMKYSEYLPEGIGALQVRLDSLVICNKYGVNHSFPMTRTEIDSREVQEFASKLFS